MDKKIYKKVSDSRTEQIQILMPEHINGFNRLFGGRLMEWIDVVAAVVARRHSGCNVTTASIDNLQFKAAAYVNSTIFLTGQITYVGNTSMEVRVTTYVEKLDGMRHMINRAYLVLVALDENDHPVQVPGLTLETEEEKLEWEAGKKRSKLRKQRRLEAF
ncbi:putative acyl-CoA thioester hydrolase [Ruminiclostridium hungatei]|uniref:Putative acyl-CoA thioester hydrolase n=1 Tax=Ruminiclostridium hungatei TaxID=48256 RepID=A0A1V4SEP9_RUMHU|nr:acyl-CoA thioesterase [Ruminiclostridium hungatei]OPX41986.1 putative acyl-CoA thioester hydrolase [Ruminiclostridium hungatei]